MKGIKNALGYLVFILACAFVTACGGKKKLTSVTTMKSDTLIQKIETVTAPRIDNTITIRDICKDSTITQFEKIFVRDTDTITISSDDGALRLQISQQARTLTEREKIIQKQKSEIELLEETIKTKTDLKTVLILCGIIALLWIFPGIPSTVNRFVRRLFGSPV